jgi:hypothetical protein
MYIPGPFNHHFPALKLRHRIKIIINLRGIIHAPEAGVLKTEYGSKG